MLINQKVFIPCYFYQKMIFSCQSVYFHELNLETWGLNDIFQEDVKPFNTTVQTTEQSKKVLNESNIVTLFKDRQSEVTKRINKKDVESIMNIP